MNYIFAALLGTATLLVPVSFTEAGWLTCRKARYCKDCVPVQDDCGCHATTTACCGMNHMRRTRGFTGDAGLPNMDGYGVHGRYPYHSYRRPLAHPGPKPNNVNIIW